MSTLMAIRMKGGKSRLAIFVTVFCVVISSYNLYYLSFFWSNTPVRVRRDATPADTNLTRDPDYLKTGRAQEFLYHYLGEVDRQELLTVRGGIVLPPDIWRGSEICSTYSNPPPRRPTNFTKSGAGVRPVPVCAVVGNSGILTGSGCGEEIDSADFVFRCNLAPIRGHEFDVGRNSNFTTMNHGVLETRYNDLGTEADGGRLADRLEDAGGIVWMDGSFDEEYLKKFNQLLQNSGFAEKRLTQIFKPPGGEKPFCSLGRYWREYGQLSTTGLSSGVVLLSQALAVCEDVRLYGFYPFSNDPAGNPVAYRYYADMPTGGAESEGLWITPDEYSNILMSLHQHGVVTMALGC